MSPLSDERSAQRIDEGITLIEVMVAMMVFAIIASGLIAGMVTITKTTADNRAKAVAANLASQDLDVVRAIADPFKVSSVPATPVIVGRRTYSVVRTVSWVSQGGADVSCSSSTNLFFLRVNVRVTWVGELGSHAVQDDTILSPSSRTNDSTTGAIAVSVVGADGTTPVSGVSVTVTAKSGGTGVTPTTQPAATGADGCSYATKLVPGDYTVKISKAGWVDTAQNSAPTLDKTVSIGTTQSANFTYGQAATFVTNYAGNYAGGALLPMGLQTNFITTNATTTTTTPAANVKLYPFPSGYSVVVGQSSSGNTTCSAVDPQMWTRGTSNNKPVGPGVRASAAALSGQTATFGTPPNPTAIPMGVVLATAPRGYYLGATQSTTLGQGNPGCGITNTVYTYSTPTTGSAMAIALPFGSWKVYYGTSLNNPTQVTSANLSVPTNAAGGGVAADGTVTLDPRPLQ